MALLTLILYWPAVHFDFVQYDDNDYVFDNSTVRAGLTWWGLVWSFVDAHALNWHPVTWLSHMLDCQLFGLNAGAHHLVNIVFHCANTGLLFILLRAMIGPSAATLGVGEWHPHRSVHPRSRQGRGRGNISSSDIWRCAFVTALFAWHPLRVESVAWISERKDVLSGFFFMLTLLAYTRYAKERYLERTSSRTYYAISLIFFTLGLLSKPMLVTLPFILLLLDVWPLSRFGLVPQAFFARQTAANARRPSESSFKQLVSEKLPFFALSVVLTIITFLSQRSGGAVVPLNSEGIGARLATALAGYLGYLKNTFWPRDLAVIYLRSGSIPVLTTIFAAVLLLSVTIWSLRSALYAGGSTLNVGLRRQSQIANRKSAMAIGWLWFVVMLLPVCGLVQVGPQLLADRYTYLPSIGLAILLVWALPASRFSIFDFRFSILNLPLPTTAAHRPESGEFGPADQVSTLNLALWTLLIIGLLTCATATSHQLAYWRNTETLMTHALTINPNNYIAHQDLAVYYSKLGQIDAARAHRQKVRELDPARR